MNSLNYSIVKLKFTYETPIGKHSHVASTGVSAFEWGMLRDAAVEYIASELFYATVSWDWITWNWEVV